MARRRLNRKRLPKWTKCLSAQDIRHLKEWGMPTGQFSLRAFAKARQLQREQNRDDIERYGAPVSRCNECSAIETKLIDAGHLTLEECVPG